MNQTAVVWTVIIAAIVLLVCGGLMYNSVNNRVDNIDIPTAGEIASLITVPEAPVAVNAAIDEKVDRVCELTNGCEYWEPRSWQVGMILNALNEDEAADDLIDELSNLINLDDDEYELASVLAENADKDDLMHAVDYKDMQIRAYSDDDKEDRNWEIKLFLRITYQDIDESDSDHVYVVLTSTLDEGEYDELSIEEVSRNFEFE